jgi:hypothetical protein
VNSDQYVQYILEAFFEQPRDEERQYGYTQQYGTVAHIVNNSMTVLQEVFIDRIITSELWAPRSYDLNVYDFYLWGKLTGKVYRNNPQATQNEIRNVTASIMAVKLQRVLQEFFNNVRCVQGTNVITLNPLHNNLVPSFCHTSY